MSASKIEWTDVTWNPTRGCSRVSEGCRNCYAERLAARFSAPGEAFFTFANRRAHGGPHAAFWTGKVALVPSKLDEPLRWKRPRRVFVNSMSDLFHEALDFHDIAAVYGVMAWARQHTFQVLTKRPERRLAFMRWMGELVGPSLDVPLRSMKTDPVLGAEMAAGARGVRFGSRPASEAKPAWPLPNVWEGVSVEDPATAQERLPLLIQTPAAVRFVSYEPALAGVDFRPWLAPCEGVLWLCERCGFRQGRAKLHAATGRLARADPPGRQVCPNDGATLVPDRRLDWIIVGGESGPGARPFDVAWARSTVAACREAGVAVFVKQLGARPFCTGRHGEWKPRDPKGGDMAEWSEDLRVREFPRAA